MIGSLRNYSPHKKKYMTWKTSTLFNEIEFYKEIKMLVVVFETGIFPLPRQYLLDMDDWKKDKKYYQNSCLEKRI